MGQIYDDGDVAQSELNWVGMLLPLVPETMRSAGGRWCSVLCIPAVFLFVFCLSLSVLPRLVFTGQLKGMVVIVL